jgi:hypothetical protein
VGAWLPAIVVAALAVKSAAAVAVWQLERRRPCLGMRLLAKSAALWLAIVAAVAGAGAWLIPPALSPVWMTVACAALLVPFNRLAAAPSALAWNRHR